ncbi:uncharacterized protein LOC133778406 [Humulus lupulus]|uniref:uncharacterized protein LOC133778406 n=1 Tax=Humulus lupulus TaxID=3486 RepID=UPI002B40A850|nr:uncharacterized protein LOC133778406 [Humulus lupulus]
MRYVKSLSLFQDLLKTDGLERGRLLGLDVGTPYIGLAVFGLNNNIASPLSVLVRKKYNIELIADNFKCLISELSLEGFVVGLTFDRQKSTTDSVLVKLFLDELSNTNKLTGIKYTYWDERFTSRNVEMLIKPLNLHPVHSKTIVDKFAAVGILQEYLDYVNKKQKK